MYQLIKMIKQTISDSLGLAQKKDVFVPWWIKRNKEKVANFLKQNSVLSLDFELKSLPELKIEARRLEIPGLGRLRTIGQLEKSNQ